MEWGDPQQALRMLEDDRRRQRPDPGSFEAPRHDEVRLLALVRVDRFHKALESAAAVERVATRLGAGRSLAYVAITRGLVHVHRGDIARARAGLASARAAYPSLDGTDQRLTGYADLLQALLDLASGRPEAVVARTRRREAVLRRLGGVHFVAELNLALGQAMRRTGEPDELDEYATALREGVPEHPAGRALAERIAGWAAAAHGEGPAAVELLERSADTMSSLGLERLAASARLDACEVRDSGDPVRTSQAGDALSVLERLGCAPEARRARRLLRGESHRPRRRSNGLTERELEVARLVADGLTDAEIAHRLVVSPRTVTTHLQHAFRRLGISRRAALARHVLEGTDT